MGRLLFGDVAKIYYTIQMRNIIDVIEGMKRVVPTEFHSYFLGVLDSIQYTAPEAMGIRWEQLSEVVNTLYECNSREDWATVMGEIFSGRRDYKTGEINV